MKERYLGQHFDVGLGVDEDDIELARIAILSFLGGRWHAGMCLVDGEGRAVDLLWKQSFEAGTRRRRRSIARLSAVLRS